MSYRCGLASIWISVSFACAAYADPSPHGRVQAALETWLGERQSAEKVTGNAAHVSFGGPGPAIEAFAGEVGRGSNDAAVDQARCSTWAARRSHFAAAVVLKREAAGHLSLDATVGNWLPEYPSWGDVGGTRKFVNGLVNALGA